MQRICGAYAVRFRAAAMPADLPTVSYVADVHHIADGIAAAPKRLSLVPILVASLLFGHASARWRAINPTAKLRKSRWSRPVGSSATLANKASPDIAACMWAALKREMAYWVSEMRGPARLAFRAASIRAR